MKKKRKEIRTTLVCVNEEENVNSTCKAGLGSAIFYVFFLL